MEGFSMKYRKLKNYCKAHHHYGFTHCALVMEMEELKSTKKLV